MTRHTPKAFKELLIGAGVDDFPDDLLPVLSQEDLAACTRAVQNGSWDTGKAVMVLSRNWYEVYRQPGFDFELPEQAIAEPCPALSTVACYKGKEFSVEFIILLITDFMASFTVGKGTTSEYIRQAARRIYERWYWLKVSDFKLVFSRARRTLKTYDAMDANKVEQLLHEYDQARTGASVANRLSEHAYFKSQPNVSDAQLEQVMREEWAERSQAAVKEAKEKIDQWGKEGKLYD